MSLQLILGSSGSGKSHYLYHQIMKQSRKEEDTNFLVVVPEQFTMQTQKDLVTISEDKGIMNVDVLSFLRLAYRVFEETPGFDKPVLEDVGKSMVIRKILASQKEKLKTFGANVNRPGFVNELKSMLSELLQYNVDDDKMEEMIQAAESKPMLKGKLQDVLTVYHAFSDYMREKYITAEEVLQLLSEVAEQSNILKNSVLCLDGFTGFTPSQYELLATLMKICKRVYITVTIDQAEDIFQKDEMFRLFYLSKKTIQKCYKVARNQSVVIEDPYFAGKGSWPYRFRNSPAIESLEKNLFRYPTLSYGEEQQDIQIHARKNAEDEIAFAIIEIQKLLRKENYRYRDIAIVSGDIGTYGRLAEREMKRVGIPCFVDNKKDVLSNALVEMLLSLLDILYKDFDYESILRFLRCGLTSIEREDIDILENFIIARGIRGIHRWKTEWKSSARKVTEAQMERVNAIRKEVVALLGPIQDRLKGKNHTVLEYTKALYDYLEDTQVFERIEKKRCEFEERDMALSAREYAQIYRIVMELFDHLVELLGEETVNVKEYTQLLQAGLEEAKVGLIPPGVDQIMVGDIERTRLKDIKALFFLGVNDGIIPKASGGGGILSDMERELLAQHEFELAPTERESIYIEQFYLYLNLTKPQNKLYITYSKVGEDGKSKRASYLIAKVVKLFPKIKIIDEKEVENAPENLIGADEGIRYLLQGLREFSNDNMDSKWKEVFRIYFLKEDFRKELEGFIESAFYVGGESSISKAVAGVLYGKELSGSVSRLERYAACAFSHFLAYGLQLQERQEYAIGIPDMGNIFHAVIEEFSRRITEQKLLWRSITSEQIEEWSKQCVEVVAEEYGDSILQSSMRNAYVMNRVERIIKRTIWALCEHMKKGSFEAKGYELSFSFLNHLEATHITLEEGNSMQLSGRIDRMDTCETEDSIYVKVIDYKSGNTTFDIVDMYYGLQMQLVVYLSAALELEKKNHPDKKVAPAGIFYYHIEDPIIGKTGDKDKEMLKQNLLKELKLNGLVNADNPVIKLLDQEFTGKSDVIPVEIMKSGAFSKNSSVVDGETFEAMTDYVKKKMQTYGNEIMQGQTQIRPYKKGDRTPCQYCSYLGICGFDKRLSGYQYQILKQPKEETIWKEVKGDDEVDHGSTEGN